MSDNLDLEKISILVADDSAEFREGLRALLETLPDIQLVGETATGEDTVRLAAQLQPDVILMDINMPAINGIEATRQIVHTSPHIRVLVLTMFEDDDLVFSAVRAGARGYLLKGMLRSEVVRSIRAVNGGGAVFGPGIAQKLMDYFARPNPPAPPRLFPELTEREREILSLMTRHLTNPEIAHELSIREKTVRNQVSNILNKLHDALPLVAEIAAALDYAHSQGLVHRDIKPSNVLLDPLASSDGRAVSYRAVLTDFGIAKIVGGQTRVTRTALMGTLDYIAPEQIQSASEVGPAADLYSLGVVVYELLTGKLPFKHPSSAGLLMAHLMQPAPDPRELVPDLPVAASIAVQRALAKIPEERYPDSAEFVKALQDEH